MSSCVLILQPGLKTCKQKKYKWDSVTAEKKNLKKTFIQVRTSVNVNIVCMNDRLEVRHVVNINSRIRSYFDRSTADFVWYAIFSRMKIT